MIVEEQRRDWRERNRFGPLHPSVTFVGDRLELGAGSVLARLTRGGLGDPVLTFEGGEARTLALLSVAWRRPFSAGVLENMRRAAREWTRGEKCLAHIHLAFGGLSRLEEPEEAAYRLFLAEGFLRAGVSARDLMKALGFDPSPIDLVEKAFNPDQPRVPKGSGPGSGEWAGENGGSSANETNVTSAAWSPPGPSQGRSGRYTSVHGVPKNAVSVRRPDGAAVTDPSSPTGILLAPPQADYGQIYSSGEKIAQLYLPGLQAPFIDLAIGHGGAFDFQRNTITMQFFPAYTHASNYSVGVYMAGAGYSETATVLFAETFALVSSTNYGSNDQIGWIRRGWEDAHARYWKRE